MPRRVTERDFPPVILLSIVNLPFCLLAGGRLFFGTRSATGAKARRRMHEGSRLLVKAAHDATVSRGNRLILGGRHSSRRSVELIPDKSRHCDAALDGTAAAPGRCEGR
jgi:hypothetical protein